MADIKNHPYLVDFAVNSNAPGAGYANLIFELRANMAEGKAALNVMGGALRDARPWVLTADVVYSLAIAVLGTYAALRKQ